VAIPIEHIQDSQKLLADAEIDLFELTPTGGGGTVYFKADNDVTWQGHTYEGLPITFVGFKKSTDGSAVMPKLTPRRWRDSTSLRLQAAGVRRLARRRDRDQAPHACCSTI
jgi:lambda family phage minor tail protein L